MVENNLELISIFGLIMFFITMYYHWHMIVHEKLGYSQRDIKKDSENMRRRIEEIFKDNE